jgi:two-component system chemotaxis response regulator CheB
LTIAQDPATSLFPDMPRAAIDTGSVQHVLTAAAIKELLLDLAKNRTDHA